LAAVEKINTGRREGNGLLERKPKLSVVPLRDRAGHTQLRHERAVVNQRNFTSWAGVDLFPGQSDERARLVEIVPQRV
jgi:hypothetical protein